ncbi:hypothetical protein ACFLSS_03425 [Bacteroidota bacterium]
MKTILFTLLLTAAFLLGCADTTVSPPDPESKSYELIKLPPKSGLSVETAYSQTVTINGEVGGEIEIEESYFSAGGQTVEIYAQIIVPPNAFTGDLPITMTVDDEYAAVWFTPHIVFNNPVKLKMSFTGIDLDELMLVSWKYDLLYIDDDGTTEVVGHDEVQVIESQGAIRVHNTYLNHFSRYSFTR